jgi:hypothetical protein
MVGLTVILPCLRSGERTEAEFTVWFQTRIGKDKSDRLILRRSFIRYLQFESQSFSNDSGTG